METFMGLLVIVGLVVCYLICRAVLGAMGIIMFDTAVGLIIKPMLVGFFTVLIGLGVIGLLFKGLFMILGWLLSLIIALLPLIIIIALIYFIVKVLKNR
jgi:hypothetical protein